MTTPPLPQGSAPQAKRLRSLALLYAPDAYTTTMKRLMGRNVAGDSFLRALLRHGGLEHLTGLIDNADHRAPLVARAKELGFSGKVDFVDRTTLARLAQVGTLFVPGPGLEEHARRRCLFGPSAWSLCGVTHTTASARVMDGITEIVAGTVQPWDAIVCTSDAVAANVRALVEMELARLSRRFGVRDPILPKLPVIPLGLDADGFVFSPTERAGARKAMGIGDDEIVVLFVGRLSFHAKANPLPMYAAIARAAKASGKRAVMVECGWFANEAIGRSFEEAAAAVAADVRRIVLDGREGENRTRAWASADVFSSLSDNIQETFGLTPIEAMAAGLPSVVTDWNGYKDTVRDGIDGYRVRTLAPGPGAGLDLAFRHAVEIDDYDRYCAHASALTAVDTEAAAEAFGRLFASPSLRREMGAAARARAVEVFDWSQIVPRYLDLWGELGEIRAATPIRPEPWPGRPDPFASFRTYPTDLLAPGLEIAVTAESADAAEAAFEAAAKLSLVNYAGAILAPRSELVRLVRRLAETGPTTVEAVVSVCESRNPMVLARSVAWLAKVGVIRWSPPT